MKRYKFYLVIEVAEKEALGDPITGNDLEDIVNETFNRPDAGVTLKNVEFSEETV